MSALRLTPASPAPVGSPAPRLLDAVRGPADLRGLDAGALETLAAEIRELIVDTVSVRGGHLGSNLGVVELTLALHRVFDSPQDILLWDTGHQAYVHKILTGRRAQFSTLRQPGGLAGYPSRSESEHDWVENSHASTILSYAYGLAAAVERSATPGRRIVAVIGDGALTGGMAYEGLNNLGHAASRVVIVLNDNGRSYAPTVSRLSQSWTALHPQARPPFSPGEDAPGHPAQHPAPFFESLGVRYAGPFDGHDVPGLEKALEKAWREAADSGGPVVVHALTRKGRGYPPAECDDEKCLHDVAGFDPVAGPTMAQQAPTGYTRAFSEAMVDIGEENPRVVAISAAMAGPTGLRAFGARWPGRLFDVGIGEQQAVTSAAGMAMGGLRPVVALYSTFFSRAFDQANLDVGLHGLPVVFALDRAGITGDDGPSHHGILDLSLCLKIAGLTILAPSTPHELAAMLRTALDLDGPAAIRYPKGMPGDGLDVAVGSGLSARRVLAGEREVCLLAVGKMLEAARDAAALLAVEGIHPTVWDVRAVRPLDPVMLADAADHQLVVTLEDGIRVGGAGAFIAHSLADARGHRAARPVLILGVPTAYIPHGKPATIFYQLGLDATGVASAVLAALHDVPDGPPWLTARR
ncbi:MAG TPA: 1-deoxy-D-xylulose-5-phosphate synthase [Actinomycetota bacterium]|nr:1-deoxy-D-xylulose-5-phosphate synthase [Actinomycetota bacterium]